MCPTARNPTKTKQLDSTFKKHRFSTLQQNPGAQFTENLKRV